MVMLRILLYVAAVVALFVGAVVYGGNAIGAWDPLPPAPEPPPAVKLAKQGPKDKPAYTKPSARAKEKPSPRPTSSG
jgi:hypothetical protein